MISRRLFSVACAICAAAGFVASPVTAQAQGGGPVRNTLSTIDYPGDGKVSILQTLDAPAGMVIPKHTHPGIESSVVMEGEVELEVAGQPTKVLKAGEGFQIPPGVVHGGKTLSRTRLAITYVVEKDKPLASPA
jgi:quercetin dioxygenase-like cupin family protein